MICLIDFNSFIFVLLLVDRGAKRSWGGAFLDPVLDNLVTKSR